jgi:hypothetical protein
MNSRDGFVMAAVMRWGEKEREGHILEYYIHIQLPTPYYHGCATRKRNRIAEAGYL